MRRDRVRILLQATVHSLVDRSSGFPHYLDSVLAYKQRKKLGRFAQQGESSQPETDDISQLNVAVNARCEVESGEGLVKRGTVRFVGPTQFGKTGGIWVGVEYDAPYGKNDGS
jgi:tubulin-folding cofactor B